MRARVARVAVQCTICLRRTTRYFAWAQMTLCPNCATDVIPEEKEQS